MAYIDNGSKFMAKSFARDNGNRTPGSQAFAMQSGRPDRGPIRVPAGWPFP